MKLYCYHCAAETTATDPPICPTHGPLCGMKLLVKNETLDEYWCPICFGEPNLKPLYVHVFDQDCMFCDGDGYISPKSQVIMFEVC